MSLSIHDFLTLLPLALLAGWALLLMVVDLWLPADRKGFTALMAALGLAVTLGSVVMSMNDEPASAFNGMVVVDSFARFLHVVFLATGIGAIAVAYRYLKRMGIESGEYYTLILLSLTGMMLMSCANNLLVVFLALELLSIPLYILAGMARPKLASEEASLKYFLLGTFASGFVLYGVALIFGATASTGLQGIVAAVYDGSVHPTLFTVGAGLLLVGIAFKIGAVPFHMWAPDVYQGSPSSVTAFMSVGAKAAAVAALLRVVVVAFPSISDNLTPILWGLSALTMIVGNVVALAQSNIKRLLAYSSIASAGFLLMAFVPFGQADVAPECVSAMLFYLVAYAFGSIGAWAVIISLEGQDDKGLELQDFAGLAKKSPWLALAMAVFMLSFMGMPPTLGFWGKLYLFRSVIEGGYMSLAIIGLLTSLVSAFYYLRLIVIMFMQPGEPEIHSDRLLSLTAGVAALAVVLLSFIPAGIFDWAASAILRF